MDFDAIVKAFAEFLRQQQGMAQPFQGLEAQPSQQEAPEATMAETAATPSMLSQTFGMQAPTQNLFAQTTPGMAQPAINSIRSQPPAKQPITNIRTPAGGGMSRGLPVRNMASRLTRIF